MGQAIRAGEGDPHGSRRRVGDCTAEYLLATAHEQGAWASDLLAHAALGLVEELCKRDPQCVADCD